MSEFIVKKTAQPTFTQKGLVGYQFPLSNTSFEAYEVNVEQGHDDFIVSKEITHTYFVIEGSGCFDVIDQKIVVTTQDLIEIPPGVEYTYSGKMRLLLLMSPPWFEGNETITKPNPNVT